MEQSSRRGRLNVHGAINLELASHHERCADGRCPSTIWLLMEIEAMYPRIQLIHVFLDNTKYTAQIGQAWLAQPDCRIKTISSLTALSQHFN